MVKIAFNLQNDKLAVMLRTLGVIDLTVHPPSWYKKHHGLPRILETDYRKGHLLPRDIVQSQLQHASDGDLLVAPDVLLDKNKTVERINEYISHLEQQELEKPVTIIVVPQGTTIDEWWECLDELACYADVVGLPARFLEQLQSHSRKRSRGKKWMVNYETVKMMVNEVVKIKNKPYHLMGWDPVQHYHVRDIFLGAVSVDTKSSLPRVLHHGKSIFLNVDGSWSVKNEREKYLLPLEWRVATFFAYFKLWLDPATTFDDDGSRPLPW